MLVKAISFYTDVLKPQFGLGLSLWEQKRLVSGDNKGIYVTLHASILTCVNSLPTIRNSLRKRNPVLKYNA